MSDPPPVVHVGVDVGGTNTDAAVLHGRHVIGWSKQPTTADVTSGLKSAVKSALDQAVSTHDTVSVERVHIGTTHFINAVLQLRHLAPVAVIRLCGTASLMLPPFSDFPQDLKKLVCASVHTVDGGYEFDGQKEIKPVDEDQIVSTLKQLKAAGTLNIVVSGIFSPTNPTQEIKVGELISKHYPEASVTLSHEIGQLGLLERENAAVLNESLKKLCERTLRGYTEALARSGLTCPCYLTQNDGTLMSFEQARKLPVFTFASGPTNSMRGAAFLSGLKEAIVLDIGGTSTDIGVLTKGFPRQASLSVEVGRVRTNFRMPDLLCLALGGGSHVTHCHDDASSQVEVGPLSVGYCLQRESVVFGGDTLTATDIAVAAGLAEIGSVERSAGIGDALVKEAVEKIHTMVENGIDSVKLSKGDVPVILVGGGSILLDQSKSLKGVSQCVLPDHYAVANAVGAALSQVSGNVDITVDLSKVSRQEALQQAEQHARQQAVLAGADPHSIQMTELHSVELSYLPSNVVRVQGRAVGDLRAEAASSEACVWRRGSGDGDNSDTDTEPQIGTDVPSPGSRSLTPAPHSPVIDEVSGEWLLTEYDVECISLGAGVLGCGGGGDPYIGTLRCLKVLREGHPLRVITPERFVRQLGDSGDYAVMLAQMGAPTVIAEKLSSYESLTCVKTIQQVHATGISCDQYNIQQGDGVQFIDKFPPPVPCDHSPRVAGLISGEIGGSNSMEALWVGGLLGLPVLDCDGMGRAFPELQHFVPFFHDHPLHPSCLTSEAGRIQVIQEAKTPKILEDHLRKVCVEMGCSGSVAMAPMFSSDLVVNEGRPHKLVMYSMSRAWRLGNAMMEGMRSKRSPVDVILDHEGGHLLITGKITDCDRRTTGGFVRGSFKVQGFDRFQGQTMTVQFQNENLVASMCNEDGTEKMVACVPDLITVVDHHHHQPIGTEHNRYGLRVAVIVLPAPPELTSPRALDIVGPQAFGYCPDKIKFTPMQDYTKHDPVGPL